MLNVHNPVDQWSHSQATLGVDNSAGEVSERLQEVAADREDLTVTGIKAAISTQRGDGTPAEASTATNSVPSQTNHGYSNITRVQSTSVMHVHASQPSSTRPSTPALLSDSAPVQLEATGLTATATPRPRDWQNRNRPLNDTARSTNRLSGFFSNLIHRRDNATPAATRPLLEPRSLTPVQPQSLPGSRASSPAVPTRPTTPPPALPPPALQELGLSLSTVTATLSPSHFSTPPTGGTFLAPHYLLLCHAQGLDVLPLLSPPAPQPYALVRRVSFKCVVVMEHRGVLVAIAGRRDGVRVYALEEVKKVIEWRIEVEIRRERERTRREELKRIGSGSFGPDQREWGERKSKFSRSTLPITGVERKEDYRLREPPSPSSVTTTPKKPRPPTVQPSSLRPVGLPPPYTSVPDSHPSIGNSRSVVPVNVTGTRGPPPPLVMVPVVPVLDPMSFRAESPQGEAKSSDWQGASDDEAIDMLTAGASGSQALDERTSSVPPRNDSEVSGIRGVSATLPVRTSTVSATHPPGAPNPPSSILVPPSGTQRNTADVDGDEEDDDDVVSVPGERITLAQALLESRLPDLPPAGTVQPQEAILIPSSTTGIINDNERLVAPDPVLLQSSTVPSRIGRRRWSTLGGVLLGSRFQDHVGAAESDDPPTIHASRLSPSIPEEEPRPLTRSLSTHLRPSTAPISLTRRPSLNDTIPPVPTTSSLQPSPPGSRIFPRFFNFNAAFNTRRTNERPPTLSLKSVDVDSKRHNGQTLVVPHTPPPKLEYVKLPGTKGALMIKAVETQKKSFLAILCGENGEKVELFAGTYKTALGLSRTFILPDSPKSLELQLQGDDLVEVFLMFAQNVFGLEPATVRVREVRIGRAERRAARRRVREIRSGQNDMFDTDPPAPEDDDIGLSVHANVGLPSLSNHRHPQDSVHTPNGSAHEAALAHAEELMTLAFAQLGPYTTFQQLSFAPRFPLATIADDYIIPPTYPDFLGYRAEHEPDANGNVNLASIQFSPPGLPMPAPAPPSRWFYRDPKGTVHGPWKASLMQAWYKDGLLPPDLPVRKEEEEEFILLKDLRQQCVDPVHPFRSAPPPPPAQSGSMSPDASKPLLQPISLLMQPRHFGPPALFYSSRGGHSTSIVDSRGRAVLKGRFVWSADEDDTNSKPCSQRMGDVKRLETFHVKGRSVIIAVRQGGVEAMDYGDALFKPADESRSTLPAFCPPPSNINRRLPFVWKMGSPVTHATHELASPPSKSKTSHLNKKASYPSGKFPARGDFVGSSEGDNDVNDEVLFLGRSDDDLYICERTAGTFRILRLCPAESS